MRTRNLSALLARTSIPLGYLADRTPIVAALARPARSGRSHSVHYRCPFCDQEHDRMAPAGATHVTAHCWALGRPLAIALVPARLLLVPHAERDG
jgi:hypothetical protein